MTLEEFEKRFQFDTAENSPDYRGSGGFGAVYRAYDSQRERYVAIKESVMRPEFRQFSLRHEVETNHEMAPHPNLLRYENNYRFQMGKLTVDYAVMKYFEHGNLDQFLRRSPDLPIVERDQLIAGLLAGLQHLRNERCIHRDLKASNVLVDKQEDRWVPVIADFGQSRFVGMGDLTSNSSESFSLDYAAPEQFEEDGKVSMATDMWAFGVLLHRIVTGRLPFVPLPGKATTGKRAEVLQLITGGQLPIELSSIDQPYQEAIRQCLIKDPLERALPSTIQVLLFGGIPEPTAFTLPGTVINRQPYVPQSPAEPIIEPEPPSEGGTIPKRRFLTDPAASNLSGTAAGSTTGIGAEAIIGTNPGVNEPGPSTPVQLENKASSNSASGRSNTLPGQSGVSETKADGSGLPESSLTGASLDGLNSTRTGQDGPGTNSGFIISHESSPAGKKKKRGVVFLGVGGLVAASIIAFFLFRPTTKATVLTDQIEDMSSRSSGGSIETTNDISQDENAIVVEKQLPAATTPVATSKIKVDDQRPLMEIEAIKPTNIVLNSNDSPPVASASSETSSPKPEEKTLPIPAEKPTINPNEVLDFAEQAPEFPGGEDGMARWINQHLRYPAEAQEAGIGGKVYVSFVIEKDGTVSNVIVVRHLKYGTDKEAVRVVSAMPKWKPGWHGGTTVRVKKTIPIQFRIE